MKEIVEKWREFMEIYKSDPKNFGHDVMWKPDFYDFMQWLLSNLNTK